MNSTLIVCPVCSGTEFEDKGRSGSLLMACKQCGSNVSIKNGGAAQVQVDSSELDRAKNQFIYATDKPKKAKDDTFVTLSLRVPKGVNLLVRAGLLAARHIRGAHGQWFAGAVIGDIFADYISSIDWSMIPYIEAQEIQALLIEAAECISVATPEVQSKNPQYGRMVKDTGVKVDHINESYFND